MLYLFAGGSTGLGLSLAKKYAAGGAKVSIIARRQTQLDVAKAEIEAVRKADGNAAHPVFVQSCDVTDYAGVQKAVDAANSFHARVTDHVVTSAGIATPGYFADQDISVFRKMMDLNYFGMLYVIKAALPAMVARGEGGKFVVVGSGLSLCSWIGYGSYSASKYAVRGLCDALRNELKLYNMSITVFYPGNIDSPGFVEENKTKPEETKSIEGVTAATHPDDVAQCLINSVADGQYTSTNETMIFFLRMISNGVAPRVNTPLELILTPLVFVIQFAFGLIMDITVYRSRKPKSKQE